MEKQIGIYKITNQLNQHCYVGQSRNITKRWADHCSAINNQTQDTYEYPLYRAMRKYGLKNFSFEILELCSIDSLNEREQFWIQYYNPEYNQTIGKNYNIIPKKLTYEQVQEIQNILIQDKEGTVSHTELAQKYNVSRDTIRDINVGRTWIDENFSYPLHYSKYDANKPEKKKFFCLKCGKEISRGATLCIPCNSEKRKKENPIPIEREVLKEKIRKESFLQIGKEFSVSDNAIRKWCKKYNLPFRKKDINSFSPEEWALI